jgi:hypothetical protein
MTETMNGWISDEWTDRPSELLDDELEPAERLALEEHLRSCPGCRGTLEQLRAVKVRAGRLRDREPGPAVWEGIARQIGAPLAGPQLVQDELAARRGRRLLHLPGVRVALAAAALLLLGVGIGRMSQRPQRLPGSVVTAPAPNTPLTSDAYRVAVVEHLNRTEALLTSFRASAASGQVDADLSQWAGQMLTTTRLLLDSPAADDPRLKALLQDLELVLAQISSLPRRNEDTEVDLARRAMDESRVLPRMRTLVPPGSPVAQGAS